MNVSLFSGQSSLWSSRSLLWLQEMVCPILQILHHSLESFNIILSLSLKNVHNLLICGYVLELYCSSLHHVSDEAARPCPSRFWSHTISCLAILAVIYSASAWIYIFLQPHFTSWDHILIQLYNTSTTCFAAIHYVCLGSKFKHKPGSGCSLQNKYLLWC